MIGIVRDIVRAGLVLVVIAVGLELLRGHREAAAPPTWQPAPPTWQPAALPPPPPPQIILQQPDRQPERPLRRVAAAITEVGDALIGVVR